MNPIGVPEHSHNPFRVERNGEDEEPRVAAFRGNLGLGNETPLA